MAVPVAPPSTMRELRYIVDEGVCIQEIEPLYAIGLWYVNFAQVTDDEVRDLLRKASGAEPLVMAPSAPQEPVPTA